MSAPDTHPLLELQGIGKSYNGVRVLWDVDLAFHPGSLHAIVGENGAGKTTLIEILAGNVVPTTGTIAFDGAPAQIASAGDARELGIAVVHQHLSLAPNLSIAENIFALRLPVRYGLVARRRMHRDAQELLDRYGIAVRAGQIVGDLSVGVQQQIEIVRALSWNARVIALDEPTSSLGVAESEQLFEQLVRLRDGGTAVILVTHRINDVFALADHVSALRDGRLTGTAEIGDIDEDELVRLMIGRDLDPAATRRTTPPEEIGETVLRVADLRSGDAVRDVSLQVRRGEIVGMYGLVGAGRSELAETIFGVRSRDAGTIEIAGTPLAPGHSPREAMGAGVALLPEDRTEDGVFADRSVAENLCAPRLRDYGRVLLSAGRMRADTDGYIDRLAIKGTGESIVKNLSGGNQQKALFGRWLATGPQLLIADEPTRGVDVGTKALLHRELEQVAASGQGVLMISSDLPEILAMSDRIYVMADGRLTDEMPASEATEERVLRSGSTA